MLGLERKKKAAKVRGRLASLRLTILWWCTLSLMLMKLLFLIIDCLINFEKVFFYFDEFSEKWELNLLNPRIPKILISLLANGYLLMKFPLEFKRNSKSVFTSSAFQIALSISFLCEVLFETESRDILSLTCLVYSMLYEDLFDEVFDKQKLLWFEIIRLALMFGLAHQLWRIIFLVVRNIISFAILHKIKEVLFDKVYQAYQEKEVQASITADFKRLAEEAPSAFFMVKTNKDLSVNFLNREAAALCESLSASFLNPKGSMDSIPEEEKMSISSHSPEIEASLWSHLGLTEDHSFICKLREISKAVLEYPEVVTNIDLGTNIAYEAVIKYIEWQGNNFIMLELRASHYQHVRMTQELLDVCKQSVSEAELKFWKVIKFIEGISENQDPESLRAAHLLRLYKNSIADYFKQSNIYRGVLSLSIKEDRAEKVMVDGEFLQEFLTKIGNFIDIINLNRLNSVSLYISS